MRMMCFLKEEDISDITQCFDAVLSLETRYSKWESEHEVIKESQ